MSDRHDPARELLARDLRALGRRGAADPVVGAAAQRVLDGLLTGLPSGPPSDVVAVPPRGRPAGVARPRPRPGPRRRLRVAVAVLAVLAALLAAPPVRAQVAEWFRFAGVDVRLRPGPAPSGTPTLPAPSGSTSLGAVRARVGFAPLVPAALGPPDAVEVSPDDRVASLTWRDGGAGGGAVRLDQFDGSLEAVFLKSARVTEEVRVGDLGLWFDGPHEVAVQGRDGTVRRETARLAGRTLIWQRGGLTLRLEGSLTRERALAIAASVP